MLYGISRTLQQRLQSAITHSGGTDWVKIGALQGDQVLEAADGQLMVFLYAIEQNAHLRNLPPAPTPSGDYVPAPLVLTLQYMITYVTDTPSDAHEWLTEVLRTFASQQHLGPADLDPSLHGRIDGLTVRLRSLTIEELNRLWTALNVGMRLALFYEVDAALIEPDDPETTGPVERRLLTFTREPVA
jgi:hypothetical protein